MSVRRRFLVLASLATICGALWGSASSADAQSLSAAAGPQQMVPSGAPATYPSAYPSTATPAAGSPALSPYDSLTAGPTSSYPLGADGTSPAAPVEFGVSGTAGLGTLPATRPLDLNAYVERTLIPDEPWSWQVLPSGLLYKSYLAGNREPRMSSRIIHDRNLGWLWDNSVGARVGMIRYGSDNDFWPQGWQLDAEGAAFPRVDLEHDRDLDSVDFRAGVPLTTRQGPWEFKFGYYHLSSHLGDEFLVRNHSFSRLNYVRESLVSGLAVYLGPALRLYTEAGWAFYTDGGAQPWEFQFGVDCSSPEPTGFYGAPFFAINAHLRQENDFGGNMSVQTGWQWRGRTGHLARLGMQYFNGMSDQYEFFNRFEEQIGLGLWYDY